MGTYMRHPLISKFQNQRNKERTDMPSLFILLQIMGGWVGGGGHNPY